MFTSNNCEIRRRFKPIKFSDQRTKSWFLSNSPGPLLTIIVTYLYFCLYAGPRYMKNRKPFQLKNTLIVYNVIQVVLSVVLVIEVSLASPTFYRINWTTGKITNHRYKKKEISLIYLTLCDLRRPLGPVSDSKFISISRLGVYGLKLRAWNRNMDLN